MHGGLGLSHGYIRPYFDQLSDAFEIVFYDQLGNGLSERPEDLSAITFERLVSDAAGLMSALGHHQFVLLGHSFGGFVAQLFAAAHPDRLSGLVLSNTVPAFDYQPDFAGTPDQMEALGKIFGGPMTSDEEWRTNWNLLVQMFFYKWDEEVGDHLDRATLYDHRTWNASAALLGAFNTLDLLPMIKVRTLATVGRHDKMTPPTAGAERLSALMPNATLRVFENSAHYPFIEEEAAYFTELRRWLG